MKDALTAVVCALAVSCCAWGIEGTVYLPGPITGVQSVRFEEVPSDADSPVDWRMDRAPALGRLAARARGPSLDD
jgi:hypothetical protein